MWQGRWCCFSKTQLCLTRGKPKPVPAIRLLFPPIVSIIGIHEQNFYHIPMLSNTWMTCSICADGVYKVVMPQLLWLYKSRHLQGTSRQEAHELTSREFQGQNTSFTLHFFLWVRHCRTDFQKSKSIRFQVWPFMSRSYIPPQNFLPQLGRLKITWDHNVTRQFF